LTNADNIDIIGVYKATRKQRKTNMETLLAISMTTTMAVVGLWIYSSFKWQRWGKI
jgi:hypothetical protein